MTRWRRPGADEILVVCVLLEAVGVPLGWGSHLYRGHNPLLLFLGLAFLTWRVAHGNRLARVILIISSGEMLADAALAIARQWDLAVIALVVIGLAQMVLLTSPSVYGRTRHPVPAAVRAPGWAQLLRLPPTWLPWLGLLAGVVVTAACLGHMDWVAIAGCRPAASSACTALAEGYPLRWLTAEQNVPVIAKAALLRDCVQWAVTSASVLYLGWLWLTAPASPPD